MSFLNKLKILLQKYFSALFAFCFLFILVANGFGALKNIRLARTIIAAQKLFRQKRIPRYPGEKFKMFSKYLDFPRVQVIGYSSDQPDSDIKSQAQFAQAQYALAPIILDTDFTKHSLVLLNCSSKENAKNIIHMLNLKVIALNRFGIILGEKR